MPIEKMDFHGDWSPGAKRKWGFRDRDAKLLSSEKARGKICRMWRKIPQKINLCFVRTPESYKTGRRTSPQGKQVDFDWVKENLNIDITPDEETITMIYAGNDDMAMSGWILAHRMAHAIRGTYEFAMFNNELTEAMRDVLQHVYRRDTRRTSSYIGNQFALGPSGEDEPMYTALARAMGTMRSARDKTLIRPAEFAFEVVAQYLIQGKEFIPSILRNFSLAFNDLPSQLSWGRKAWGQPTNYLNADPDEKEEWNDHIKENLPGVLEYYLSELFTSLEGKIFFMQ